MKTLKNIFYAIKLPILLAGIFISLGFNYTFADNHLPTNSIIVQKKDSIFTFKKLAFSYAQQKDTKNASVYIEKYIKATQYINFINNDEFIGLKKSPYFNKLEKKYQLNFSALHLFYLFSSLIGFFISIILMLKRKKGNNSILLLSAFVFMHSIFIFHIFIFLSNLQYHYPHTLFMSITFSFLYGPLIYFYFKKTAQQYQFKWTDLLHILPTMILMMVVFPIYLFPKEEKLKVMLHVSEMSTQTFVNSIFYLKLISLLLYGFLVYKIYIINIKNNAKLSNSNSKWQKTLVLLGLLYIASYAIYGLTISKLIPRFELLYHLQIILMAVMVLYIGTMAYLKPNLFKSDFFEKHLYKYKKSGLTASFSEELKQQLLQLLEEDKIYRQNNISLEILSEKLGTSRHNTSQVINEHFNLNFFDLINKYRITEALEILQNDRHKNLNIIDVAYEVGFNNKVTFNKSFKKILSQTPSQYLSNLST